jgi:selenocysteine lyase/cysteine desulfurase
VGRRLFAEHRIEVLAQEWRGMPTLRLSFQGYNDERDLDRLLDALRRVL